MTILKTSNAKYLYACKHSFHDTLLYLLVQVLLRPFSIPDLCFTSSLLARGVCFLALSVFVVQLLCVVSGGDDPLRVFLAIVFFFLFFCF